MSACGRAWARWDTRTASGAVLSPRGQTDARVTLAYITNYERQPCPAQAWESTCKPDPSFHSSRIWLLTRAPASRKPANSSTQFCAKLNNQLQEGTHVRIFNTGSNSAFIYKMV